ncbi:baseplate multidomain protein megatron, partial [Profundibacter sp.]
MATIVLSSIGFAAGASVGGAVFGLSSAVIGRAIGATLGRVIDQRIMGAGSQTVETGKVDRFRLTGASEGAPVGQVYGAMRIGGQVIWASRFQETSTTSGGGKGAPSGPKTTSYNYTANLAIALCEGVITRVGRVWADGIEIARDDLNLRVYTGSEDQMPDPKIEAVEGAGNAPAYRGIAYVVLEDLPLGQFGNRIPQFTFEVLRPAQDVTEGDIAQAVQAVALIPGTGEYGLATTPVHYSAGYGVNRTANMNTPSGKTDFVTSVEALGEEMPNVGSVSLVVSWFGNDLRCGSCDVQPKVEQAGDDGTGMPWSVSGVSRGAAAVVPELDGRSVYGGTPTDQSVIEAIQHMTAQGKGVVFYPFVLMDQLAGNGLSDPYTGAVDQPALPWRGRITLSVAPGQAGSPDGTAAADAEVAAFFGAAAASDFTATAGGVSYSGPAEWSYRRFVLHYAHLCAAVGGVDAFLIGSELRGLTQIRGAGGSFPVVQALRDLAADVRSILGAGVKISYAADWSEYFGYQPQDGSGDRLFHLDALWADANIDFVGIDNYMPLSDWREGYEHLDAGAGSIYNLDYLKSNIMGGEGYDWYYHSPEARAAQIRTPITDDEHGEPWIYRFKDIKSWWSSTHHERIGGVRQSTPTAWEAGSKPVWFTELGCAAVDKGTNEPNKFVDPKSSESSLPRYSDGTRDELIQMQYLRAMHQFWNDPANNPVHDETDVQMVDMAHAHVWAWDARPFPYFPNHRDLWADGDNYARGHWLNGRTAARSLASVVAEICERSGVTQYDVSRLYGYVRGYSVPAIDGARAALQPLMLAYGFDAVERDGVLIFRNRDGRETGVVPADKLAVAAEADGLIETTRAPVAEVAGRIRLNFVEATGDYEVRAVEAVFPDEATFSVSQSELPLALTGAEGRAVVERWLAESRVARDGARFALPMSELALGAGDVVRLPDGDGEALYRLDNVEQAGAQMIEAVRVEGGVYRPSEGTDEVPNLRPFTPAVPVYPLFMDLPLLRGDEVAHAPHLAVTATPWPGSVAVYSSSTDAGYGLNRLIEASSVIGVTETVLPAAHSGLKDHGAPLRVKVYGGDLSSAPWGDVLNGANLAAIGDGSDANWEVFQFAEAVLVAEDTYDLSLRLRGQAGSDGIMPAEWPAGSQFVLLNGVPEQIDLALSERGLSRHYRIG